MENFEQAIADYAESLRAFVDEHELPSDWFKVPDHIAIKGANAADFEAIMNSFKPLANQLSYIEMDGRRLGTAQIISPITIGTFGSVSWVEIMEPRPEKVGKDVVGMEHMEFYYPHFDEVKAALTERNIPFEQQQNPGHAWINIVINNSGQELKINDRLLADAVTEEIQKGITKNWSKT